MKLKHLFVGAFLSCLQVSQSAASISDGLIAHYTLDDTSGPVIDSAGSFDGTNNGAIRGVPGIIGNAFQFDGNNDFVDTLPVGTIPTTSTISLWIRPDSGGGNQVFGSVENASGGKDGIILNWSPSAENVSAFYVESNNDQGAAIGVIGSVPVGQWTLVTYSWDPVNNVRLYINGQLNSTGIFSTPPSSHDRTLMFGKSILSQDLAFPGLLDDIRIWDRALSPEEVASIVPESSAVMRLGFSALLFTCRTCGRALTSRMASHVA